MDSKTKRIFVNAGGTSGFMVVGDCLRKVTLATGASTTLRPTGHTHVKYTALCYGGNSVLYGAYNGRIGSINQTTGAFTLIAKNCGNVDNIIYKDTDELWYTADNCLVLMDFTDGSYSYVSQTL